MHVLVIGAGLAGVTSAWYLRQAGFEVTLVERCPEAGLETSFANGGQISISHPEPWANPSAPRTILRWLGRPDAPLLFRLRADPAQWRWGLAFLRECLPARARANTHAIASLAAYSREQLVSLRQSLGLAYDQQTQGILHLFFDPRELALARAKLPILGEHGIPVEACEPARCVALEPALGAIAHRLAGGLHGQHDESGDAHRFTQALAGHCQTAGVRMLWNTRVDGIEVREGRATGVAVRDHEGRTGLLQADQYLVCAGPASPRLARAWGERLPIYPVKGYSITVPVADPERAPHLSLTDESRRVVCSRLGDRLRVAGTAEVNGYDLTPNPARSGALTRWLDEHLPGAADTRQAEHWCGLRPATPGNLPIIGASRLPNVHFNTGHGSLGWTLACGSAAALADLLRGRKPAPAFPFRRLA
ncbi:MAG: D-amino acid dehydrogenase [Rhodocyclaceae bacterium]|jgi:D-amino-acid dehydrogenase|nr:D-amino acid dehydrogenase [Rhodocyclaceae bacterium]